MSKSNLLEMITLGPIAISAISLPLRSLEVSTLHLVAFFLCLDKSLPLWAHLVGAPHDVVVFPTQQALARHLAAVHRPHGRPCYAAVFRTCPPPPSCSAIHPGPQCLGYRNGGLISPASRPNAGRALGHGKCSVHDWSAPPHLCMSMLALSPSRTAIALPRLGNATSRVAVAAAGGITGSGSGSV